MALTQIEIFMLGWRSHQVKAAVRLALDPFADPSRIEPPSEAEINQIIRDATPAPEQPCRDGSQLKEHPIG